MELLCRVAIVNALGLYQGTKLRERKEQVENGKTYLFEIGGERIAPEDTLE